MPQHMDPATGKMIDDDPQPEPNIGGLAAQQQEAAAMSPAPIPPPSDPSPALAAPDLKLPEPSLSAPGAPAAPSLTIPGDPPTGTGDDLIPAPIPAGPDATLAPSAVPPKPLEPADTVEGVTDQQIAERKAKAEEDKAAAETRAAEAKEIAAQNASFAKARADIVKSGEDAYAASKANQAAAYDQYRALGEKDAWGDNATGLKAVAAIALLLGGRRAAPYIIGAANGFEANKKEALAQQAEAMKQAGKETEEVRTHMNDQVANLSQQTAAGLDATAAKMDAELAARGVPKAQRDANKDILEIKQKALEKREEAQRLAHKQAESDAKEALMNHKIEADTRLSSIRADQIAKKMAGGGGGGVSKKELRAEAKAKRDDERLNLAGMTAINTEMKEATKDLTQKGGLIEQQQHLDSSLRKLEAGESNPVEWTNAIDAAIRTNTGRAAIRAQYDLYTSHAGGKAASFENWLQEAKDGQLGDTYKRNLLGSFKSSLAELQREGAEREKNFRETYQNDHRITSNPEAQAAFFAHHKNVFGKLHGGETIGGNGTTKPAAVSSAAPAQAGPDPMTTKAQRALTDPKAPPAAKAAAIKYLKSRGINPATGAAGDITL